MHSNPEPPSPPGQAHRRRPEVDAEILVLNDLTRTQLLARLRACLLGEAIYPETLIYLARAAWSDKDRERYLLVFEVLVKKTTGLILGHAARNNVPRRDREDHVASVYERIARAIQTDKPLEFAERRFHRYLLVQTYEVMRRYVPSEKALKAAKASMKPSSHPAKASEAAEAVADDWSNVDHAQDPARRALDLEELKHSWSRTAHLPPHAVKAYIQWQVFGYGQKEIADRFGVSDRAVRDWINKVEEALRAPEGIKNEAQADA